MAKIRAVATRKQVMDLFDEHSNRGLTADVWHMETGFTNISYFTEIFTKSEKIPPTEYRKDHR